MPNLAIAASFSGGSRFDQPPPFIDTGIRPVEPAKNGRFDDIDMLRGVAASCVVLSHYTSYCVLYLGGAPIHVDLVYGLYAVYLFFIISGFVIYRTIEKCRSWVEFVYHRITRLYPAYWTALTLVTLIEITVFGQKIWWGGYVTNMTMLQEFLGYPNLDNVYWSLTVELGFYGAIAVFFAMKLHRRMELLGCIWLLSACLWSSLERYPGIELPIFMSRYLIFPFVPYFIAGVMFSLITSSGANCARIAILLLALASVWWMQGTTDLAIAIILFSIFGLALAGRLRFLVSRVTLWLGAISYSLYLTHRNLGYAVLPRLHDYGIANGVAIILAIAGALALASLLCFSIERPATQFFRRWSATKLSMIAPFEVAESKEKKLSGGP